MAIEKLSLKQIRFVAEYVKDGNGTQAAIRAGYSEKSAKQIASELILGNADIISLIEEIRSNTVKNGEYNLQSAVRELDENIQLARNKGNMMAVSKMLETKIKIHGLLEDVWRLKIEKVDVTGALREAEQRLLGASITDTDSTSE